MTQNLIDFDWWGLLTDRAFLQDPYPELARLQQAGPVHRDAASGVYFVLGHRAFGQIAKMPQMGRDTRKWRDGWDRPGAAEHDPVSHQLFTEFSPQMINVDAPDHGRMRGVYEPAFHPSVMARLGPMITDEATRLLDAMPQSGTVDMMSAFAAPLPLRVLRNLFAMPPEMDAQMSAWSAALIKIGDIMMTPDQKQEAAAALTAFKAYLRGHLAARRLIPGDGMIDRVIAAWDDERLNDEETLTNLVSMLVAGHETTVTLIGNGLLLLLENPGELRRLRSDRALMRTAIEEFMRVSPGGNMILRVALEDVEMEGVPVPAGSLLIGLVGAVNRDPARFERPEELDIGRRPNPHFTFGGGVHFCIGAPLARLEAQIGFDLLLDRFAVLELDGVAQWRLDRMNARGLGYLPVRVAQ
jgi:cytochrome P450